jgi:hypothetical protein
MDRTHCSKIGVFEIEGGFCIVERSADEPGCIFVAVVENSDSIDCVELAGLLWDIGCRKVKASVKIFGCARVYDFANDRPLREIC